MFRMPGTNDIVTILIELQVKPDGIVRTATETVISLMVAPRIYYFLHHNFTKHINFHCKGTDF
jgi:hypothetical protein